MSRHDALDIVQQVYAQQEKLMRVIQTLFWVPSPLGLSTAGPPSLLTSIARATRAGKAIAQGRGLRCVCPLSIPTICHTFEHVCLVRHGDVVVHQDIHRAASLTARSILLPAAIVHESSRLGSFIACCCSGIQMSSRSHHYIINGKHLLLSRISNLVAGALFPRLLRLLIFRHCSRKKQLTVN